MKFSRLERATDYEVQLYLIDKLELNEHQKKILRERDIVRYSKYLFYKKRQEKKVPSIWRLSIVIFPIFWLILFIGLPFTLIATGRWGYGHKLHQLHSDWANKLGL